MRLRARNGIAALVSLAAFVALTGAALATDGTTTPVTTTASAPPCVGAGLVAILEPDTAAATTVGPALAVAVRTGLEPAPFSDAATGVQLTNAQVGAAGCVDGTAPGGATARSDAWSVFGGAVAGTSLRADLLPTPDGSNWHLRAKVEGLTVGGTPADPITGSSIAVGDWGVLDVHALVDGKAIQPLRYWAAALELTLTKAHSGFPAGTRVLIGYVAADRKYAPPPPPPAKTTTTTTTTTTTATEQTTTTAPATTTTESAPPKSTSKPKAKPKPKLIRPKAKPKTKPKPLTGQPLKGTPPLGAGSYVFPVDGRTDWGDSYGADRSDVPGGWHHGDDLFAPLGTPVVAVTDGTIFSVGWNRVGGWRLWLLDANGNQYYYAHLSGYTAAGSNDRNVKKGQVLGFVGNTGDAVTTPSHLHFEVHPSSLLYLGYDGAVDPTTYLRGWALAQNVVVPPPVDLPSKAPPGQGSAADFRQLLSIRPLKRTVKAKPTPTTPHYLGHVRAAEHDGSNPEQVAAAATAGPSSGGEAAIIAGAVLAFSALIALVLTARAGRSSSE